MTDGGFIMWFVYLLAIIIALVIDYAIDKQFEDIAEMKGHEGRTYFWFTSLTGVAGMLMVIALPNKKGVNSGDDQKDTYKQKNKQTVEKTDTLRAETSLIKWRCDNCGNMRSQTPCEYCGRNENVMTAPYRCGKCGQEGPYDGNCPTCGSSLKFYNH